MKSIPTLPATLLGALLLLALAGWSPAGAAADELTLDQVSRGSLLRATDDAGHFAPLPLVETAAVIGVTGPIARARVRQRFVNPSADWIEAIYAFPLPEDAAVDRMRMRVGELIIEGDVQEKAQARRTYETAKREGRRASLVEQHRPNLFTNSVANIPPGGEVTVEIEYQQPVHWRDATFSLRFPMAITPRFKPGISATLEQSGELNGWSVLPGEIPNAVPLTPDGQAAPTPSPVTLRVRLEPGFELDQVTSPYHAITRSRDGDAVMIELAPGAVPADRDFELRWSPRAQDRPQGAFFTEHTDAGDYGLLMLMPPADAFAGQGGASREQILVIDSSGSMGGASMRQAKAALALALDRLRPGDYFNVIDFDNDARALFAVPVALTPETRDQAQAFVTALDAGGGTQIRRALELALAQPTPRPGLVRQIVFTTDGAIGNEDELLRLIHRDLGDARLFMVGIGSAPNAFFMTEAAEFGRGSATFIGDLGEVRQKMESLFGRIERPALTSLRLDLGVAVEMVPNPLPDLYAGEPLVAVMKLDAVPTQAVVSGDLGTLRWTSTLALQSGGEQRGIGVQWAREKIRHWMRVGRRGGDAQAVRDEVVRLALAHHLVSQYTSLVAVDKTPVRVREQVLASRAVAATMPHGWEPPAGADGRSVAMASGATPATLYLWVGMLLCLLGWAVRPARVLA